MKLLEKDDDKRYRALDNFDGNGTDFRDVFSAYIEGFPKIGLIERDDRHWGEAEKIKRNGRTFGCRIVGGRSGIDSFIQDDHRGESFDRKKTAIEREKYRLLFAAPSGANTGLLLIEGVSRRTLPPAFRSELTAAFHRKFSGYRLEIGVVSEENLWAAAEDASDLAEVTQLTVVRQVIPDDESAALGLGSDDQLVGTFEQTYNMKDVPRTGSLLTKVRRHFTGVPDDLPGGIRTTTSDGELPASSDPNFEITSAELVDNVIELVATVELPGENPKLVKYSGARPPQIHYYITGIADGEDVSTSRFYTEAKMHMMTLLREADVKLDPNWDEGKWEHPSGVPPLEVRLSDAGDAS